MLYICRSFVSEYRHCFTEIYGFSRLIRTRRRIEHYGCPAVAPRNHEASPRARYELPAQHRHSRRFIRLCSEIRVRFAETYGADSIRVALISTMSLRSNMAH